MGIGGYDYDLAISGYQSCGVVAEYVMAAGGAGNGD